jgi:hypothetical protein
VEFVCLAVPLTFRLLGYGVALHVTMAQWSGQFSGLTHETKVQDIEASLRKAISAFDAAPVAERETKSNVVHELSNRLFAARLKALRARLSALREPGLKHASDSQVRQLQSRELELQAQGVAGILGEFGFHEKPVA